MFTGDLQVSVNSDTANTGNVELTFNDYTVTVANIDPTSAESMVAGYQELKKKAKALLGVNWRWVTQPEYSVDSVGFTGEYSFATNAFTAEQLFRPIIVCQEFWGKIGLQFTVMNGDYTHYNDNKSPQEAYLDIIEYPAWYVSDVDHNT
jgi:hypothetical protein